MKLLMAGILLIAGALIINYLPQIRKSEGQVIDNVEVVDNEEDSQIIAGNIKTPWELVFLPGGSLLVTERPGTLLEIKTDKTVLRTDIPDVTHIGEGGLMGLALDPEFEENNYIYLYYTTGRSPSLTNRVDRYTYKNATVSERLNILKDIAGGVNHNGGRISFGPDGFLYIGTGDAGNSELSQDVNSLGGKLLRISKDGSIPQDNPFNNAVYSYGHRNIQGITWDGDGNLWTTEHGPSGTQTGYDELNLIEKGGNYGWPLLKGTEIREGMIPPVATSGATETWAPAGAVYVNGSIFFGGLRGKTLYQAEIDGNSVTVNKLYENRFGRIRIVTKDRNGTLYIGTSNTDGRGSPYQDDDKIIKILRV